MTDIHAIITELEQRRAAIDAAITALRGVGTGGVATAPTVSDGRQRQIEAMRRYWAQRKAASKTSTKKRGGITPEGRKRLAAAMRKRWAAKRRAAK